MRPRRKTQPMAGRHADPVDQAEGILWAEDLRIRARWLADELRQRDTMPVSEDHFLDYCRFITAWADRARPVLEEIGRG